MVEWVRDGVRLRPAEPELLVEARQRHQTTLDAEQAGWMDVEWQRLQEEGALEVGEVSFVSPLFLVAKRGPRKWRLVVDMRLLNTGLPSRKCRFEGIAVILQVVQRGWWFVTIDLPDGYHHVMMEPESRRFLGVCWRGVIRRFTVLVFGLNCAPWVFTKLVRVMLAH